MDTQTTHMQDGLSGAELVERRRYHVELCSRLIVQVPSCSLALHHDVREEHASGPRAHRYMEPYSTNATKLICISPLVSSMTSARRHFPLSFLHMFAVRCNLRTLASRTLSCRRESSSEAHWAVLRVVEFKRNLDLHAEMKRDSSGFLGQWSGSGTRYFGAGFF